MEEKQLSLSEQVKKDATDRSTACGDAIQEILKKHNCTMQAQMVVNGMGNNYTHVMSVQIIANPVE